TRPGETGTIGGYFESWVNHSQSPTTPVYAVTCAHVLASTCSAIKIASFPRDESEEPDAALLETSSCAYLRMPDKRPHFEMAYNPETASKAHLVTALTSRASASRRGFVHEPTWYYELDGQWSRFPAMKILPYQSRLAWILSFARSPMFAFPGDSGSWVVVDDNRLSEKNIWLGMVVGGDENFYASYVADGPSLVSYFEVRLMQKLGCKIDLEPVGGNQ